MHIKKIYKKFEFVLKNAKKKDKENRKGIILKYDTIYREKVWCV